MEWYLFCRMPNVFLNYPWWHPPMYPNVSNASHQTSHSACRALFQISDGALDIFTAPEKPVFRPLDNDVGGKTTQAIAKMKTPFIVRGRRSSESKNGLRSSGSGKSKVLPNFYKKFGKVPQKKRVAGPDDVFLYFFPLNVLDAYYRNKIKHIYKCCHNNRQNEDNKCMCVIFTRLFSNKVSCFWCTSRVRKLICISQTEMCSRAFTRGFLSGSRAINPTAGLHFGRLQY